MAPQGWDWPAASLADPDGLVGVGADLGAETILSAYRRGLFPMPTAPGGPMAWWSPDPRGVIVPSDVHVSRSLRRSMRRFEIRVDTAFGDVLDGCADPARPHGWIDNQIRAAYRRLHRLGHAHSVEVWDDDGLAIGGLFAAESMFHNRTDASKAAVVALAALMDDGSPDRLIDVQWTTDHLVTLGAVDWHRGRYLAHLDRLTRSPGPEDFRPLGS